MTTYFHGVSLLPALSETGEISREQWSAAIRRLYVSMDETRAQPSARRRAMFDKAAAVMRTASAVAGANCIPEHFDHTRTGLPWGLCVELSYDRMMIWSPRGGFQVSDVLPMPF